MSLRYSTAKLTCVSSNHLSNSSRDVRALGKLNTRPSSNRSVSTPIRLLIDLNSLAITGLIVQTARTPIGTGGLILVQVKSDSAGVAGLVCDSRSTVHAPRISSPAWWTE